MQPTGSLGTGHKLPSQRLQHYNWISRPETAEMSITDIDILGVVAPRVEAQELGTGLAKKLEQLSSHAWPV